MDRAGGKPRADDPRAVGLAHIGGDALVAHEDRHQRAVCRADAVDQSEVVVDGLSPNNSVLPSRLGSPQA